VGELTASFTARPASADAYILGEGPLWDADRQRLLWVDIVAGLVCAGTLDPASGTVTATTTWVFDGTVGAVAVAETGDLLVAERRGLTRVDPTGTRTPLASVLPDAVASRLNDGAVDPAGRFLVGSMALDDRRGEELLVRLDSAGCTTIDADLTLSNGLGWSPAGDRFYSTDTVARMIWVRDYDRTTGATGPRQELIAVTDGHPDGLCVDVDGNLWIAIWGRGRVECRTPGGDLLATVAVDAPHTSSVAFAGPDLDVLVVTTATDGLRADKLASQPHSGRLFTARVGAVGLPTAYWKP
jgi:sugar lactone lactonase YvrE